MARRRKTAQRETLSGLATRLAMRRTKTAAVAERSVVRLTDSTQQISRQSEAIDTQVQTTLANVRTASPALGLTKPGRF